VTRSGSSRPPAERAGDVRSAPSGPVVRVAGLAAGYHGRPLWSDATFDVHPGEFVAVLGPNGAGKSTLLRVMLGLVAALAGSIEVLGEAPRRGNPGIGYVPQQRPFDPDLALRGVDLVRLGLDGHRFGVPLPGPASRDDDQRVRAAVEAVGAGSYAERRVGRLSGGERQRLLLAQALVSGPRLLLLDEPLTSLDVGNQASITEVIAGLARRRSMSVCLVAHDVNPLLPFVDRVLYVVNGRVAVGRPGEVISTDVLSRLYGTPVEVLSDSRGRLFVVGLGDESAHPHRHPRERRG
jgi:zinc/manganese transport system ATP-binding protein